MVSIARFSKSGATDQAVPRRDAASVAIMKSFKLSSTIHFGLIVFLLIALFPAVPLVRSQQIGTVQVVVRVYIDGLRNPAGTNLTVQLLDSFGTIEKEGHTDIGGVVQFQAKVVTSGSQETTKRLRIYGPGIKEYEEQLYI